MEDSAVMLSAAVLTEVNSIVKRNRRKAMNRAMLDVCKSWESREVDV